MSLLKFGFTKSSNNDTPNEKKKKQERKESEGGDGEKAGKLRMESDNLVAIPSTSKETEKSHKDDDGDSKSTTFWKQDERKRKRKLREEWEKEYKWLKREENDWRSSLSIDSLDALLRIVLDGPESEAMLRSGH